MIRERLTRFARSPIIVRASFRKCTPFLNSEYNFQFYRRVIINLQQYHVRRNPRAQRCTVAFTSIKLYAPARTHPLRKYALFIIL